jgi:hypothetical protein
MRENIKTVILKHLTADKLVAMVIGAIVVFITTGLCRIVSAPLSNIARYTNG